MVHSDFGDALLEGCKKDLAVMMTISGIKLNTGLLQAAHEEGTDILVNFQILSHELDFGLEHFGLQIVKCEPLVKQKEKIMRVLDNENTLDQ